MTSTALYTFLAITFGALFAVTLTLNESPSEPLGLYRPTHEALKRNRLVLLTDPLKRLVGMPGDRTRTSPEDSYVNNRLIPNSRIPAGSPYRPSPFIVFVLEPDQYWMLGDHPLSYDCITAYPSVTVPQILAVLLRQPGRMTVSARFICWDPYDAQLDLQREKQHYNREILGTVCKTVKSWFGGSTQADQDTTAQVADLNAAIAASAAGMAFGWATIVAAIRDPDPGCTQSLVEIVNSPYRDLLLESCPGKIFLPNSEAGGEYVRENYHKLGVNEHEISIIANASPQRQYYYRSPIGSHLFTLALGDVAKAICASTGYHDMQRARRMLSEAPDGQFLNAWLRERLPGFEYQLLVIPNGAA